MPYAHRLDLRSRFNSGITHNFDFPYGDSYNETMRTIPSLKKHNITGFEQCLSIIDTGIDEKNQWLIRPNLTVDSKIYTSLNLADDEDEYEGHGTFVAGIAAGKAYCSEFAKSFNGVAEDARIYMVDIKNKKTGKLYWPENFLDLFQPSDNLKCPTILNAWTIDDPLLTTAMDIIAYKNPKLLMIFPSLVDKDGGIVTPGAAKNILSVGAINSLPIAKGFKQTETTVTVFNERTNEYYFGYTDPCGIPFLNTTYTKDPLELHSSVGIKASDVHIVDENSKSTTTAPAALVFTTNEIKNKFNFPVIRLSPSKQGQFKPGDNITIIPSPLDEGTAKSFGNPDGKSGIKNKHFPFFAKPELSAPGGPMLGPKAGSSACGLDGLTIKEGPSVASAIIAGSAVLARQILQMETMKGIKHIYSSAVRAAMIASADYLNFKNKTGPIEGQGFGVPQLERIIPTKLGNETKKVLNVSNNLHILHNNTIKSDSRNDYCLTSEQDGVLSIALVWHDYPRDPRSNEFLSQPLYLNVATDEIPYAFHLANNDAEDQPTLDHFNTAQRILLKVRKNMKLHIKVVSGHFSIAALAHYSIAIVGNISWPDNYKCDGYFVVGNCPRECRGRGSTCRQNKLCQCSNDRGGDFCDFRADKLEKDKLITVSLTKRFEWSIFKYLPDKWSQGMSMKMIINGINYDKAGFMVNSAKAPTFENNACSEIYCPWATFDGQNYTFKYEDWDFISKHTNMMFGFYQKTKEPQTFTIEMKLIKPAKKQDPSPTPNV
ncbi:hypothetical protein TVAG_006410 [Trichomonas vaginalis G3]|uniref:EGF-like domain-containing protein n=1 Tax=Trichomonas vaginalis (strain ATCC PRA-98 / G3) TaxID=412133 RepID=A2E748_TRIV3|nr:peptidases S8 Kp43 protease domain-containing protein [Trichomonas vaginalis G3]EAY11566.1 hypothetical protein TVAG_006410 [Trichomonas vaginalis G3]KAI5489450.1 peptidases S8 Kp43 protease domain-containing protein [Trichomonas vaginalis G3]|eukprot:XP_001323789.1 hypothetical protein [Trichomonas vaginalis G3]